MRVKHSLPTTKHVVRINEATEGRNLLAEYCSKKINEARMLNNLPAYLYFMRVGDLIADSSTGLILGSLIMEMPRFIYERELSASKDTVKMDIFN